MSLLRLLATGKSLVGMKDTNSPYRMRATNLLPKFGSPKNPFATPPKADAAKTPPAPAAIAAKPQPVRMETVPLFDAKPKAPVAPPKAQPVELPNRPAIKLEPKPAPVRAAVPASKPAGLAEWAKKINPLTYLPARMPGAKKPARAGRTPVQTELSLEKVKVVRNDLSDTDVEIVQGPTPEFAMPERSFIAVANEAGSTAWNRLTSRLAGAGETLTH